MKEHLQKSKKEFINLLNSLSTINENGINTTSLQLVFLTSLGVIQGKLITKEDVEEDIVKKTGDNHGEMNLAHILKPKFNFNDLGQQSLIENDYVLLKNVKIISGNTNYNLSYLILFFEQIIGVTIGSQNN